MTIIQEVQNGSYELPYEKAGHPATYKQIKWLLGMSGITTSISTSQLLKRLPMEDFNELIELAKDGEVFEITQ